MSSQVLLKTEKGYLPVSAVTESDYGVFYVEVMSEIGDSEIYKAKPTLRLTDTGTITVFYPL